MPAREPPGQRWRRPSILALLLTLVALLKGLRMPNLWAATQYTFSYRLGFIRRGLVGEILRRLGGDRAYHYDVLALVAFVLFGVTLALMARLIWRATRASPRDAGLWGAVLLFLASPGLVFLIHLVGYLDYIGIAIEIAVALFIYDSPRRRVVLAPVLAIASVFLALIHESALVIVVPFFIFLLVCDIVAPPRTAPEGTPSRRPRARSWLAPLLVLAVATTASIVVGVTGTRPPDFVHQLQQQVQKSADFPLRGDAYEVLLVSVMKNVFDIMPGFWRLPGAVRPFLQGLAVTLPGLFYLLFFGVRLIRESGLSPRMRRVWKFAFFGASLSPFLMILVGWDFGRWDALATLSTFLCVCVLELRAPPGVNAGADLRVDESGWKMAAAVAVILGLCSNYPSFLYDGYKVHWFPFDERADELLDLLTSPGHFIPRS